MACKRLHSPLPMSCPATLSVRWPSQPEGKGHQPGQAHAATRGMRRGQKPPSPAEWEEGSV